MPKLTKEQVIGIIDRVKEQNPDDNEIIEMVSNLQDDFDEFADTLIQHETLEQAFNGIKTNLDQVTSDRDFLQQDRDELQNKYSILKDAYQTIRDQQQIEPNETKFEDHDDDPLTFDKLFKTI